MAFIAVDKNTTEWIYHYRPARLAEFDIFESPEDGVKVPKGTAEKLTGKPMSWEDDPRELK